MANIEEKVIHDHDYCVTMEKEDDIVDSVVENLVQSSPKSPLSLSPTYSCDSGIDSFACGLANEFGKEGDDLFNFLLDDDFHLGLDCEESQPESQPGSVKPSEVSRSVLAGKKSNKNLNASELSTADRSRKNAEAARENRKKKKTYIFGLEKEARQLRAEKNVLIGKTFRLEGKLNELQDEVDYLKGVLANQSMLSKLLERVSMTPGVSLSTSFCSSRETAQPEEDLVMSGKENTVCTRRNSRKRSCNSQKSIHQNASDKKSRKSGSDGVCLHVKDNKVSLEFCRTCSKRAEN